MKKICYLFLVAMCTSLVCRAKAGDTTFVQAHYGTQLSWYGNYDTAVVFPNSGKTYRKVIMTFTLGKYHCPAGSTYCGDWDYTVQTFLMTKTGDTMELGRLITPYANASYPRTPWSWTQRYYFDVTDFYPLLKDSATIRILYSGYSGGFTADVNFEFIEGTPDRNVVGIQRLWNGTFTYGSATDPIDNHFASLSETAPAGTNSASLKFTVTGHGSDSSNCGEFCEKYYQLFMNGSMINQTNIWRDNCGFNELYPQSGTWIYNRANWCPGALVHTNIHDLPGITAGSKYNVNINFQPYVVSAPSAVYISEAAIFYYGAMNKTLDASLDYVTAPTTYEGAFRENPLCGSPSLHIKNTGSTTIDSIQFQYGVDGVYASPYTWTGSLAPLHDTDVYLPEPSELRSVSGGSGTYSFTAKIAKVNGSVDDDTTNNTISTSFLSAPQWPSKIVIGLQTDKATLDGTTSSIDWKLYDLNNNLVAQRTNNALSTTYQDTVSLVTNCYKLVVENTACDGLNWLDATYVGTGSIRVTPSDSPFPLKLNNYFSGDFGCGFTQYFTTIAPAGVPAISQLNETVGIEAYPNPAQSSVIVNIMGIDHVKGTINVIDALGRIVLQQDCNSNQQTINVVNLANGMYTLLYTDAAHSNAKLVTRLLIAK